MTDVIRAPQGAVQQALELQLFGRFATIESTVTVETAPTIIMQNNPERIGFVMVCTGDNPITFALSRSLTVGKGFILSQAGDTVTSSYIEDAELPTREFSAIAETSSSEVYIAEFIRVGV